MPILPRGLPKHLAEVSTGRIHQLTKGPGSNVNASWAPDGMHIVFESDRSGNSQIYIMLMDGSELRRVTHQGINTCPSWSGYPLKETENP